MNKTNKIAALVSFLMLAVAVGAPLASAVANAAPARPVAPLTLDTVVVRGEAPAPEAAGTPETAATPAPKAAPAKRAPRAAASPAGCRRVTLEQGGIFGADGSEIAATVIACG